MPYFGGTMDALTLLNYALRLPKINGDFWAYALK
ncbi:hypothetical protein AGR1C_Cc70223 [Agrobacterium fabacearum TT111]|nr:hypothetical protein AGR1C_Cc70223 [Agrobacterium fabacearum TT111]